MKKTILVMMVASNSIMPLAQAQESVNSQPSNEISLSQRVSFNENGVYTFDVQLGDTLSEITEILNIDKNRLKSIDESLAIPESIFEVGNELSFIQDNGLLDALLVKLGRGTTYAIYIDVKESEENDVVDIISFREFNSILNNWNSKFSGVESTVDFVDLSPVKEIDEWSEVVDSTPSDDISVEVVDFVKEESLTVALESEEVVELESFELDEFIDTPEVKSPNSTVVEEEVTEEVDEATGSISGELAEAVVDEITEPTTSIPEEVVEVTTDETTESIIIDEVTESIIEEEVAEPVIEKEVVVDGGDIDYNEIAQNNPQNNGLQPHVARFKEEVADKYGVSSFSLYRPGDPQDHGKGLAIDFMVPVGSQQGDDIADYSIQQMQSGAEDISYIIWEQRIWGNWSSDWEEMEDRGSITQNHYDHVHVSFN